MSCYLLEYEVDDEEELKDVLLNKAWIENDTLRGRLDLLSDTIVTQMKDTLKSNNLILESLTYYLDENSSNMDLYNLKTLGCGLKLNLDSQLSLFTNVFGYCRHDPN